MENRSVAARIRGRGCRWFGRTAAIAAIAALSALASFPAFPGSPAEEKKPARPSAAGRKTERSRWVRIVYDDLVDRSATTHSGRTVGEILKKIPPGGGGLTKASTRDLQPYLEPFSFVCGEIVAAAKSPAEGNPYASIADDYPPGSRQPAWAALFREGLYQLFVSDGRARLFIEGKNPAALFRRHHSVVRHSLLKALDKAGENRITLEVYAFRNDYGSRTLDLDLTPYVAEITPADCFPKARELPLGGLSDFFASGPVLEAAEVDDNGDFFLYGGAPGGQTVAGLPASLEDFAVVYRAVFHHGRTPPYVSLDLAEDNRYAKVNFGGLLQDTRVGSVLLEADKLLKTLITGIDPDSRAPVADRIRSAVPDFRTVDERALFRDEPESGKFRLWFYPDRIRTVTDGRVGVVESHRFTADEERLDGRKKRDRSVRETVDHLNRNFESYAGALPPLRELQAVGRMMAIAKWLQGLDARRRVDLDALLSVELSPHPTPRRNPRILAVTDGVRFSGGASTGERHRVFCLNEILDQGSGTTDDRTFIEQARRHVRGLGIESLLPGGMHRYYSSGTRYTVTSVSGGINLDPADFTAPLRTPESPLIARIRSARPSVAGAPPSGAAGVGRSTLRRSISLPARSEKPPKTERKAPGAAKDIPAAKPLPGGPKPRPSAKGVVLTSPAYPAEIIVTGDPSKSGTIVLKKGKATGAETGR